MATHFRLKRNTLVPLFLLSALILLAGCASIFGLGDTSADFPLEAVEEFIGADIPPAATEVNYHAQVWIEHLILLRLELPPEAIPAFLTDLEIPQDLRPNYNPLQENLADDLDWWDSETAQQFAGLAYSLAGKNFQLLVDTTDPTISIVFLIGFDGS